MTIQNQVQPDHNQKPKKSQQQTSKPQTVQISAVKLAELREKAKFWDWQKERHAREEAAVEAVKKHLEGLITIATVENDDVFEAIAGDADNNWFIISQLGAVKSTLKETVEWFADAQYAMCFLGLEPIQVKEGNCSQWLREVAKHVKD